jgi:hypothetical protein
MPVFSVKKCQAVKNTHTVLIGMLVTAVALSALITPATASFVHPNGILMAVYPQDIVVFGQAPGSYDKTLAVVIKPPWYFVPNLMGFTSVTLTLTLTASCYQCHQYGGNPLLLSGANNGELVMQLGAVTMAEADNGALILVPITFIMDTSTGRGFYMLFLNAQADAADGTTFKGWTQIPVSVIRV